MSAQANVTPQPRREHPAIHTKRHVDHLRFASIPERNPYDSLAEWRDHQVELTKPLPENFPAPKIAVAQMIGQCVEVLLGHRPIRQVQNWMTPEVFHSLSRHAGLMKRAGATPTRCLPPRVRRIVLTQPQPRTAECSVALFDGMRIRAASARIEVRRGHWHLVDLEIY
ncbi:Rv3235 family protein [Arcanobacterium canis]